jgi:hypothetical protein
MMIITKTTISKSYFINLQKDVIQEDQEEDGLVFEDGTG